MYYGGYYGAFWDPTYILVVIGMIICLLASARVKSTYAKFDKVRSHVGITAAEAAERILHGAGIYDVEIRHISGDLTDNYDPRSRVLNLSDATFRSTSVAAIGCEFWSKYFLAAYFDRNYSWRKPYIDHAWCIAVFPYCNISACYATGGV